MGLLTFLLAVLVIPATYVFMHCLYNVYLHPLSKFPGPTLWCATRLPFLRSFMSGWIHRDVRDFHLRYGQVVRIAPNELSFTSVDAWRDIYSNGSNGSKRAAFPKPATWFAPQQGRPASVHSALDPRDHARMRRAMDPGFSERAVLRQEPILQQYTSMLTQRLRERLVNPGGITINLVQWLNFVAFDIIGDLGFGESFGCLESTEYHPWMSAMFSIIRVAVSIGSLRHYPLVFNLLMSIIPESAKKKDAEHWQLAVDKTKRRLDLNTDRQDLISSYTKQGGNVKEGLSTDEIYANAHFTILAGSETTVTVLTGIINHLIGSPACLSRLTKEIRNRFSDESEISLHAVKELPYLNATIEEGLRMCNPTPGGTVNARITPKEGGKVSDFFVPGETFVSTWPYAMSFSPNYFHEPNDFHPKRWLPDVQTDPMSPFFNDNRKALQNFGIGLRACIGQSLAWAEMRLVLSKLFWNFDLTRAETPAGRVIWDEQRVFGVVEKKPFDVRLDKRVTPNSE